jgi:hypothetical protein
LLSFLLVLQNGHLHPLLDTAIQPLLDSSKQTVEHETSIWDAFHHH